MDARERVVHGGRLRERLLRRALSGHYRSIFRRQWQSSAEPPHFYDHRLSSFAFFNGEDSPFSYYRAFFAAQLMRPDDRVLDIGCGDGFFAHRFFRLRAAHIDAIDIEPSAIEHAQEHYAAPEITFAVRDAVSAPFPAERYDVVVWDGALGHFPADTTRLMLEKIAASLSPTGAVVGSESLGGAEGAHDHEQFFATLEDLRGVLAPTFPNVRLTEVEYRLAGGALRREGFWRCAISPERLEAAGWR
jgi:2-polyprenyl-3-methyl-5-hydroxy-6-metoxy-1,4-benzoquinol methylase